MALGPLQLMHCRHSNASTTTELEKVILPARSNKYPLNAVTISNNVPKRPDSRPGNPNAKPLSTKPRHVVGTEAVYSGTPQLMADYARLAIAAGATIVGGCCGTSPEHLAAMRVAIDSYASQPCPTPEEIVDTIGPMVNALPGAATSTRSRGRRHES